jgi:hypothetical protein
MAAAAVPSATIVVPTDADIDVAVHIDVAIDIPIHSNVAVHVPIQVSVDVPILIPVRVSVDVVVHVVGCGGVALSATTGGMVLSATSRSMVRSAMSRGVMGAAMASCVTSTMSSAVPTTSGERGPGDDEQCRYRGNDRKFAAHGTVSSMLNPMRHLTSSPAEPQMNGKLNIGNSCSSAADPDVADR